MAEGRGSMTRRDRLQGLLNKEEGYDVEFKKTLNGLEASDIVAFANSDSGGTILVGVKEVGDPDGRQRGEVVGCSVGDKEKLAIIGKADGCLPSIKVDVFVEEVEGKSFYRVEIPSGPEKPYCTSGGTYKIRGDGRTNCLDPGKLLAMLIERESERFVQRFREATLGLEAELSATRERVSEELESMVRHVTDMESSITQTLNGMYESTQDMKAEITGTLNAMFDSAQNAESLADETMNHSEEAVAGIGQLDERMEDVERRLSDINDQLSVLLRHFGIEEPSVTRLRDNVKLVTSEFYGIGVRGRDLVEKVQHLFRRTRADVIERWVVDRLQELEGSSADEEAD